MGRGGTVLEAGGNYLLMEQERCNQQVKEKSVALELLAISYSKKFVCVFLSVCVCFYTRVYV